ncbi:MAG: serine--tRNA ligase [Bacteroidota bacterium]|nr:serine--tRNA ligase [Bacteroidota bacterium]|tara:strand:- start:2328 stop:3599 length:1272 start_codon:yes stop_codon:yes gene_type:complete
MLKVSYIIDNKDEVIKALLKRNFDANKIISDLEDCNLKRKDIQSKLENILSKSNNLSKQIGELIKSGNNEDADKIKKQTSDLKDSSKQLNSDLNLIKDKILNILYKIPNVPNDLVPHGKNEDDNEEIYNSGELPEIDPSALSHWDLAKKYDIIDFDLGNKITGSGFPVYKGMGAKLQRSLVSFFLDINTDAGYKEVQVPYLVNEESGLGTGQLPDKEGQMYHIQNENLYLIPTAEVPATNIYRDVILNENELPRTLTAYSPCFRREAGSYGSDVRGLNRLHQFDKVEILRVEHPERSYLALDEMVEHVKSIIEKLNLPYRIVKLCGSDLGFTSSLTYDFEVYSAAQKKWLEVSSVSNFESYQSNRLKLRYRDSDGNIQMAHTLNGSALALPRILATIIENCQTENGIAIPEVLIPYTGFSIIN